MRNLSFQTVVAKTFQYWVGSKAGSADYAFAQKQILAAFGSRDFLSLTPSEEEVLNDFAAWVDQLNDQPNRTANGAFIYFNMNTGASLCFVGWIGYEEFTLTGIFQ
jgi:hypothetical protein